MKWEKPTPQKPVPFSEQKRYTHYRITLMDDNLVPALVNTITTIGPLGEWEELQYKIPNTGLTVKFEKVK